MTYRDTLIRESRSSAHDDIVIWLDDHRDEVLAWLGVEMEVASVTWEWPIHDGASVVGFVDLVYELDGGLVCVGFEIKPQIECLGDVIRQLRFYEAKTGNELRTWRWIVVSPDERHADRLRAQGFGFLHWTPDE